jgi:hypothetical protein
MHCFIVFDLVKGMPVPSLKTLTKDKKFLISDYYCPVKNRTTI